MMKSKTFPVFILLVLLLSACNFTLAADVTPPPGYQEAPVLVETQPTELAGPLYPLVSPDPAAGRPIYTEKCAPCHGETGMGDGPRAAQLPNPVPALGNTELARQARPADWYQMVTKGNMERFMPGFTSLSDRQRWDVVAYAYSLSETDDRLAQGETLYQANCASCHGEQGQGDGTQAASLATKPEDLTNLANVVTRSAADHYAIITQGMAPDMPAFSDQLSEADRWALADYMLTLGFSGPRLAQAQPTGATTEEAGSATGITAEPHPGTAETVIPSGDVTSTAVTSATVIGTVSGMVTNASGGDIPAGANVTLMGYDEMTQVITETTPLPENGFYEFENIEMPAGRVFLVTVDFQDTAYHSEIAHISPETTSVDLPVEVFETTTDTSSLMVERLHLFFELMDEKTLNVVELYIVSNNGTKTVVPPQEGEPTLRFEIPEGADKLTFQDSQLGERYIATDTGFGDTVPIRPGNSSYQILFQYQMPYDRKLELAQKTNLPTNAVVALVPEGGLEIQGDTVQDGGVQQVEGAEYHIYNIGSLNAGDDLKLTISGRPSSRGRALTSGSSSELLISLAALGAALIIAGVFLYLRSRSAAHENEEAEDSGRSQPEADDPDTIMDGILTLDDLYKAGELPEEAYLQRRAELKNRLKQVLGSDQA